MTLKNLAAIVIPAFALTLGATDGAHAGINLVANGDFSSFTTYNSNPTAATGGQLGYNTTATSWTSAAPNGSYNFLFTPGSADNGTGVTGQYGKVQLWGGSNGLDGAIPGGGNFIGMDGAYNVGPLSQTITGLTAGKAYTVSFYYAGAQQSGYDGATTEAFKVGFGSAPVQETAVLSNVSHGFTGWKQESFTFVADGTSDVLSFLAVGTPNGVPPFSLLTDVSVSAVPEPSTVVLMGLGMLGVAVVRHRRRLKASA